ncbi:hypothetical protein T484DRAFT_1747012 [Baffinella frigidus]|nr:hypothetical protein T484DRAFT_1747012 [Cryptophyta sp. CCMP2293]
MERVHDDRENFPVKFTTQSSVVKCITKCKMDAAQSPSASKPAHDESFACALPMTAPSHNPMLISADFMRAVQEVSAEYRFGLHHPPAWHDELLASRHAQRAPRVSSLEAKLTSSFLPADCAPKDDTSSDSSFVLTTAPPSMSHDELLARRHAQRAPSVSSLEAKLTSSFLLDDDCEYDVNTPKDDYSSDSSSSSPSPPSASPASHLRSTAQRSASACPSG